VRSYRSYPLPILTYYHVYNCKLCFGWIHCYFCVFSTVWPKAFYIVDSLLHCIESQIIFHCIPLNIREMEYLWNYNYAGKYERPSHWPRCLRHRSKTAHLARLWVRIPPGAWMSVCCDCCVLSGRGLCDELITRPEESYRLWWVIECDLETSRMRKPWPALGPSAIRREVGWGKYE